MSWLFKKLGAAAVAGPRLRSVKPLVKSSWDMRTNIKARPGSQGTLFGMDKTQLSERARWPRGYTPERLNQVRPHVVSARPAFDQSTETPWGTGPERRKLVDTIARSTVPESHLLGVQFSPGQPPSAMHDKDAFGQYDLTRRPPLISLQTGHATTDTPIHEIGHHVSHTATETPEEQGHEEGLADNYAQQHYRDRRGRPEQLATYADGTYSDEGPHGRGASFYDAYHKVRGTDPNPTGTAVDEEIQHRYANPTLPGLEHFGGSF